MIRVVAALSVVLGALALAGCGGGGSKDSSSKDTRKVQAGIAGRLPRVLGGMGTAILSTSGGLITSKTAQEQGVGGEVICFVW